MKLDDAAARLEALGNPTRLKIYRPLVRAGEEGLPVGRLQAKLDIAASTLSHHLKTLIGVGLSPRTREGTTLICHANYDADARPDRLPGRGMLRRRHLRAGASSRARSREFFCLDISIILEEWRTTCPTR